MRCEPMQHIFEHQAQEAELFCELIEFRLHMMSQRIYRFNEVRRFYTSALSKIPRATFSNGASRIKHLGAPVVD